MIEHNVERDMIMNEKEPLNLPLDDPEQVYAIKGNNLQKVYSERKFVLAKESKVVLDKLNINIIKGQM
jgi:hypothetical protein